MERPRLKPREQGDFGELSALSWLAEQGAHVYIPLGHSPDVDLVADLNGELLRVEVKTTTWRRDGRWRALLETKGGNQSWSGRVKRFDPNRCDYLFVHTGEGRRWFIPTGALRCTSTISLGGSRYSAFEIEPGKRIGRPGGQLETVSKMAPAPGGAPE